MLPSQPFLVLGEIQNQKGVGIVILLLMVPTEISDEQECAATSEKRKPGAVREQIGAEAARQHASHPHRGKGRDVAGGRQQIRRDLKGGCHGRAMVAKSDSWVGQGDCISKQGQEPGEVGFVPTGSLELAPE